MKSNFEIINKKRNIDYNQFGHLEEISRWYLQFVEENLPWKKKYEVSDEYIELGTRYSGKTYKILEIISELISISLKYNRKIFIIATMKMFHDLKSSVFTNIMEKLIEKNISSKVNLTELSFLFENKSKILCKSLSSVSKREKLKAFHDLKNYDFVLEWREEADQFLKSDIQELNFAIRGTKKIIINSSNPESLSRYIIGYANTFQVFNEELLKSKYYQIGKYKVNFKEGKKIYSKIITINYSSWRLNNYLSDEVIQNQLELEKLDPQRARVWSWGLPANLKGSVFERFLKFKKLDFNFDQLKAGVDFAQTDSPNGHKTAASLWVYNSILKKVHKIKKYLHCNATQEYKDTFVQANDIIAFYLNNLKNSNIFENNGLEIKVDYGAGGLSFIDVLNREKLKYVNGNKLRFIKVDKSVWYVIDRVNAFIAAMISKKMTHELILEQTNTQYPLIIYKEKPKGGKEEIEDMNDDEFDSDYYALSDIIRDVVQSSTNRLIREYI